MRVPSICLIDMRLLLGPSSALQATRARSSTSTVETQTFAEKFPSFLRPRHVSPPLAIMSAYGHIPTPIANTSTLLPRSYALPLPNALECSSITLFPTTRETSPADLTIYMTKVFNEVVVEGRTYPQREQHSISEFEDYFLSALSISLRSLLSLLAPDWHAQDCVRLWCCR